MRSLILFVLFIICIAAPAFARVESARERVIVITPLRTPTAIDRLPLETTVIDRAEMDRKGYATLQDAIKSVPGVSLVTNGSAGLTSTIFLRGTETSHTLVLLDGMPVNDPSSSTGIFDFSQDMLGDIERIEIVRGPGSVLYGSHAIGGVINLITRKPDPRAIVTRGMVAGGNHGTVQGGASVSGTQERYDYLFSAEGRHTDGFNQVPSRFARNLDERDGSDQYSVYGRMGTKLDERVRVQGQIRWRDLKSDLDDEARDDPNNEIVSQMLNWKVRGEVDAIPGKLLSTIDVGQTIIDRRFRNDWDPFSSFAASDFVDGLYEGNRLYIDQQNTLAVPDGETVRDLRLIGGVDHTYDHVHVKYLSDGGFGPFDQIARAGNNRTGLYGQVQGRILDRLDLTGGARYDLTDQYGEYATWRLGMGFDVPEVFLRLHAATGTSYRTPSLFERFGVDNFGTVGNPDLQPEDARSWEAGFDFAVPLFGQPQFVSFGTTYFHTETRNLIQYNFSLSPPGYENTARVEASGFETTFALHPVHWADFYVNWTALQARNRSGKTAGSTPDGEQLLRRPFHQVTVDLTFRPMPQWSVSPQWQFIGHRYDVVYGDDGAFIGRRHVNGYSQLNLATEYAYSPNLTFFARGENLLDRRIETPNGFNQPGLTVLAGVRGEF